jgi:hypothetical protein
MVLWADSNSAGNTLLGVAVTAAKRARRGALNNLGFTSTMDAPEELLQLGAVSLVLVCAACSHETKAR